MKKNQENFKRSSSKEGLFILIKKRKAKNPKMLKEGT